MNFSGYLREEEEYPVSGTDWGISACIDNACLGGGEPVVLDFPAGDAGRSNSRRIDMAAVINEHAAPFYEFECVKEGKDIEATDGDNGTLMTREEWSANGSYDLKSEESSTEERAFLFWPCVCSPCKSRILFVAFALFALFITGLGVGLALRDKPSNHSSVSASIGASGPQDSSGSSSVPDPASQTPGGSSETPESTLEPTSFDFEWDDYVIDWEEEEQNWDTTGDTVETESSNNSPFLVGAYYYPWHGSNFHNGDGYVRRDLVPQQGPTLGEYDDTRPETISQHLRWSRQANIGLWIASWWGPNRLEDSTTKDVIMQHEELGDMKIALHYETSNRIRGGLTGISSDMEYMCENYFDHPNYYKINGRPVIFVYVTRKLDADGSLAPSILTMRTSASKCGHDVYLVGDHVFESAPDVAEVFVPFWYFDAVTNYDVYGSMGRPSPFATPNVVETYYAQQEQWRTSALSNGCRYIPSVSPGYNDRGVRPEANHPPLSRRLTENSAPGSLFSYQLSKAKNLVDPQVDNLLVVNSFNEWHEDTQIEPAAGELTNLPLNLTEGVYYEGYGELYLDLLRAATL